MRWVRRAAVGLASLVLGVAVAVCVVALHEYVWGLLLGLVTTAAALVALPGGWARLPFGIGWSALVWLASARRPEGDVVITRDASGWTLLGAAVAVLILSMIGARRDPVDAPPSDGPPSFR